MFKLNFATPDKKVVSDLEVEEVNLPAFAGELNILPGHAPLMTTLEAGVMRYKTKTGEEKKFAISWGYCQVSAEAVNVLAESAMAAGQIEVKVVKEHLAEQEAKLLVDSLDEDAWKKTHQEIARLKAELELAGGTGH